MTTRAALSAASPILETLTNRNAWKALGTHYEVIRDVHLRKLFAEDPKRGERMTTEAAGIFLDYSKNRITDETITLLIHWRSNPACGLISMPCFAATRSISRRNVPSCT